MNIIPILNMVNFKLVMLFLKIISLFIVQRSFGNITYDYVQKYDTLKIGLLRKYEKVKIKIRKAKLDATFLKTCQTCHTLTSLSWKMLSKRA